MSAAIPINDSVFWVGINDRETGLFEELWPMPHGISYNSYLIKDEKIALVDAVKSISPVVDYLDRLKGLIGERKVDYLIINHIEPDHSGAVKILLEAFPEVQIVGNRKTIELLSALHGITENVRTVGDGEVLGTGRHRLRFILTPMVHWPETMMTYEEADGILFSGDAFGGFGALDDGIFDDQLGDLRQVEQETLRYFTNVIGRYSSMVQKAIPKITGLKINTVASTHGPVWRKNPRHVIGLYDRWSRQETEEGAVIVYASMYGSTEKMMEAVARSLAAEGLAKVRAHNVSRVHPSYILSDVWRFRGLVLGSPTYNTKPFPLMDHYVRVLENKMLNERVVGVFGSYGWSGGGVKELVEFVTRAKWQLVEPVVEAKGAPTEKDLSDCALLGRNMAGLLKSAQPPE
jgi:flavorubredoxin